MLLYTCQACQRGQHDLCAGKNPPPLGMLGGSECDCDGKCAERSPSPDSQIQQLVDKLSSSSDG